MKAIQKIVFFVTATIIIAADAHAGRWLSHDPFQEGGGFVQRDPMPEAKSGHVRNDPNLYAIVRNNPINAIDPKGLDVVYLLDPNAVAGAGHAALLAGNDKDGWIYFSFGFGKCMMNPFGGNGEDNLDTKNFNSFFVAQSDAVLKRYQNYIRWTTDRNADIKAINAVRPYFHKNYNVFTCNCDDVALVGIKAAGVNVKDNWKPVNSYNDNKSKGNESGNFHPAPAP